MRALVAFLMLALASCTGQPAFAAPEAISAVRISFVGQNIGSGVHVGGGEILTAAHVVEDMEDMWFDVETNDGHKRDGSVRWIDREHDVALVQVTDFDQVGVSPIDCAPTTSVGEEVQAIGSTGIYEYLRTWGRVSSEIMAHGYWPNVRLANILVMPGMSGGPVLNAGGDVVGIAVGAMRLPTFSGTPQFDGAAIPQSRAAPVTAIVPIAYFVPSSTVCDLMNSHYDVAD